MRLSTIKLSGFKSFVDPTVAAPADQHDRRGRSEWLRQVQHHRRRALGDGRELGQPPARRQPDRRDLFRFLDAQAGAARRRSSWFSTTRKARSAASTPRYAEISVKRSVSRDGQSNYYLNGARCRRRDITDLFLGTGLGARSYSIIEQGMISQIIEARPEDLRVYLEEAAGISKYKERRKETETRIRHTRENLERLTDLREEVGQADRPPQAPGARRRAVPGLAGRAPEQGRAAQGARIPQARCANCSRCAKC